MKNKAIFIMGATASGKTNLALQLSQYIPIEIISVDSAAIYKYLDIGSAKPTAAELQQCQHHLIDILSPVESYSVAEFLDDSINLVNIINAKGKIPVFVGGTMMYYHSLIHGIHELPSSATLREELLLESKEQGLQSLYQQLLILDPIAAAKISCNDQQRIIRKLEVCKLLGSSMTDFLTDENRIKLENCEVLSLVVAPENREILYQKSEQRFDKMILDGIIDEVRRVIDLYPEIDLTYNSMKSVGYRQVWQFLNDQITYDDMLIQAKTATRHLVKRQYTWLRDVKGLNVRGIEDLSTIIAEVKHKHY